MRQIFDYLILSFLLAIMFCGYGYVLSTASMICLYATVYAISGEDADKSSN